MLFALLCLLALVGAAERAPLRVAGLGERLPVLRRLALHPGPRALARLAPHPRREDRAAVQHGGRGPAPGRSALPVVVRVPPRARRQRARGQLLLGPVRAATAFSQVILSTAAFNRSLWRAVAGAVATEALGMHSTGQAGLTYWAPNINIFRDPRWGRGQETSGEDPAVAAAYSLEYVKGFQGDYGEEGRIRLSACCKHYTAYDMEKWKGFSRYTFNAKVKTFSPLSFP